MHSLLPPNPRRRSLLWTLPMLSLAALHSPLALADGTAAGTAISNTATATYVDPNNPGQTLNATSNAVVVTVAEVAGMTVTPLALIDSTPTTPVLPGDTVYYDFKVTNVGNDPTRIFVPDVALVVGPGTQGTIQFSYDNGATYSNAAAGGTTSTSLAAGSSLRVRVPITVNALAPSGAAIRVTLGNTSLNDNSAATQNQPYPTLPTGNDLHTTDTADGGAVGEVNGPPANGEREASSYQLAVVGAQPQAFAAVLLSKAGFAADPDPRNDVLTYGLSLRVDATAPNGAPPGVVPADLIGTTITVDGVSLNRILISQAIPAATVLNATPTPATGWIAVYTTSPTSVLATSATWSITPPASLASVTRVGFIFTGAVLRGATVTGFQIPVKTSGVNPTGSTTISAYSQLMGQTLGDTTNALVYDESGDQMPSNYNDNGTPGSNTPTNGVANPATDGVDSGNNAGVGAGGEDMTFTIATNSTILNGPSGHPDAVGPTDNNDDFVNASAPIPANTPPGATLDPAAVSFVNTVSNPGNTPISNILILPIPPATSSDLPTNTRVTLTYNGTTALYVWNGTAFVFTSGNAIQIPSLAAGVAVNYTVTIDLPAGTPLSTDIGRGFPVPIRAFVDANGNGVYDSATEAGNINIDRVYTGFLKVVKEVRVMDSDGLTLIQDWIQSATTVNIRPGRYLDYRLTYTNISTAPAGNGNGLLNANNVVITEDGTAAPNNWAVDGDSNGALDTSNVVGSAADNGGAAIALFSGNPATTPCPDQSGTTATADVTKYVVTMTHSMLPATSYVFTFRRKIN